MIPEKPINQVEENKPNVAPIYVQNYKRKNYGWVWSIVSCIGCVGITVFAGIMFFAVIIYAFSSGENIIPTVIKEGKSDDMIAVVPISGVIMDDYGVSENISLDSTTSPTSVANSLSAAVQNSNVKGIILRLNTPGGSVTASKRICEQVKSIDKEKPVYTYIETEGASGGYYIASCSRYIVALEESITGSIGVRIDATNYDGLLDKLGIKTKTVTNTAGTQKESDLFEPNSIQEKRLKEIANEIYDSFFAQVLKGRNNEIYKRSMSESKLKELANGQIFSGLQAKTNGLVDENGFLEKVVDKMISQESLSPDVKVVQYNISSSWFNQFGSSLKILLNNINNVKTSHSSVYWIR